MFITVAKSSATSSLTAIRISRARKPACSELVAASTTAGAAAMWVLLNEFPLPANRQGSPIVVGFARHETVGGRQLVVA